MNRSLTFLIRFLLDECIPPIIRDNRWFMYPFYYFSYNGKNIAQTMDFKREITSMSPAEYSEFYNSLESISRGRKTDLNSVCLTSILSRVASYEGGKILDAGCGNGYLSEIIGDRHPAVEVVNLDLIATAKHTHSNFIRGELGDLPFVDHAFDVVICTHTIEHCQDLGRIVSELKRVCKHELIIVVPKQRPYYYSLDEHVHFFFYEEQLTSLIGLTQFECKNLRGDWLYFGLKGDERDLSKPLHI